MRICKPRSLLGIKNCKISPVDSSYVLNAETRLCTVVRWRSPTAICKSNRSTHKRCCGKPFDILEFGGESPLTMRAQCSMYRHCPNPLGIVPAEQFDKLEFAGMPPRAMRARCSAFRYCPDPLGIVTAKQLFTECAIPAFQHHRCCSGESQTQTFRKKVLFLWPIQ